jgi:hypothetical protein
MAICSLLLSSPAWSMPLRAGVVPNMPDDLVQVAAKKSKKQTKKKNFGAPGYIPGHVKTPYGYKDCIGWWERHSNGRMQCHGQLVSSHI